MFKPLPYPSFPFPGSYLEDPGECELQFGPYPVGDEGRGCPSWQSPAAVPAPVTQLPTKGIGSGDTARESIGQTASCKCILSIG